MIVGHPPLRRDWRRRRSGQCRHGRGLVYLNNRHHDPTLGSFVSVDPLVTITGEPYIYAGANPITYSDPTGLYRECADPDDPCHPSNPDTRPGSEPNVDGLPDDYRPRNTPSYGEQLTGAIKKAAEIAVEFVPLKDCNDMRAPGNQYGSAALCGLDIGTLTAASKTKAGVKLADDALGGATRWVDDLFGAGTRACGFRSFSADTEVLMADGTTTPISDVEIGDWVIAEDPESDERGARQVTHLWVHDDTLVELDIDGASVSTTEDHPFWNHTDHAWQDAQHLDKGDLVLTAGGDLLEVDGLNWSTTFEGTAYNLTVNDIHTYYVQVGDNEVLVHNTGCDDLVGAAAHFDVDELAQLAYQHAGAGSIPGRPTIDQISRALRTDGTRIRDDAVRFVDGDVVVIINESLPTRSTAYLSGTP